MIYTNVVCTLFILISLNVASAEEPALSNTNGVSSLLSAVGSDALYVFSAPLHMGKAHSRNLAGLFGVTTGLMTLLDNHIDRNFVDRDDIFVKPAIGLGKVGDIYDHISGPYLLAGLSVPMLAGGVVFKDEKLLQTTRLLLESYLIANGITFLAKRVVGRSRPYTGRGPSDFSPFSFTANTERRSFPSGHSTSIFSMMTVLAKQYDRWWVEIPAYTLALTVVFQRLESRNHWGADVVAGSAIGYWVGSALVNRYKRRANSSGINPFIFGNRIGIILFF